MISKKKIGDDVLVLGEVVDLNWIRYVDSGADPDTDMDELIGKIVPIVDISKSDDYTVYKLDGCPWWWAPEWLAEVDGNQLPGQLSIEDFGLVVSGHG